MIEDLDRAISLLDTVIPESREQYMIVARIRVHLLSLRGEIIRRLCPLTTPDLTLDSDGLTA